MWSIAYLVVEALFKAGHDTVIVDATNTTSKRRNEWRSRFDDVKLQYFNASAEVCIERAKQMGDAEIIPVIERMAAEAD